MAVKLVLDEVPARAWAFYRVLGATILLVPLGLLFSRGKSWPPLRIWLWLLPASILGVVLNQALFALGLERTTPAHSAVIVSTIPILTLTIALLVRQERFDRRRLLGMGSAFLGVMILIEADQMLLAGFEFGETAQGDLFILCNAFSFACFLVLMRKVAKGVDAFQTTAICFLYATILLGLWSWPVLDEQNFAVLLEAEILPYAAYAIIGGTVLTYFLNNWALRYSPSSQVAVYTYVQPLVATILSMALGQDSPDLRFFIAAALVFMGVMR